MKRKSTYTPCEFFISHLTWLPFLLLISSSTILHAQSSPVIDVWYGDQQYFGYQGKAQRWVNVLGNISPIDQLDSLTYSLNGSVGGRLTLGSDLHRLAREGDFNVEIPWKILREGENHLLLQAWKNGQPSVSQKVHLHIQHDKQWPLPYSLDFRKVQSLQKVVQILDGKWELTPEGVKTSEPYYDRVLSMGDSSWKNYEADVILSIQGFTPSLPGPPTYNVSHFGVAMRWRGHHKDGRQPSRKWFPLGAQGEMLLKPHPDSARWRILFDGADPEKPHRYTSNRNSVPLNTLLRVRTQIATMEDGRSRYRFKQWIVGQSEPVEWDIEGYEEYDYPSGALCLVPHNSDVTIQSVSVRPLSRIPQELAAKPGPAALHKTALVGGTTGAEGTPFKMELEGQLKRIQVNLGAAPLSLVKGIRFQVLTEKSEIKEQTIGNTEGNWQAAYELADTQVLVGIAGRSGWFLDAIQFLFDEDNSSSEFGGKGGDTAFSLSLHRDKGKIRGFYGTYTSDGIETLGFLFDPAD
ncbi:MAG: hypothetical protein AAGC85_04500 [Bacteroidota bacterium]